MKFLVDAHLPFGLVKWLRKQGHDTIHTSELPEQNSTDDIELIRRSVDDNRIIITKDEDFLKHYILKGEPPKLLLLTMGNITNKELLDLFYKNITQLETALGENEVVELSNDTVTIHF